MMKLTDDNHLIWEIAVRVQEYCPGELGWIAKQRVSEHQPYDDLYGFVIGRGFASVRVEQARTADDTLIRELATEVMGYAPGSIEDLENRKAKAEAEVSQFESLVESQTQSLAYWRKVLQSINEALEVARASAPHPAASDAHEEATP